MGATNKRTAIRFMIKVLLDVIWFPESCEFTPYVR